MPGEVTKIKPMGKKHKTSFHIPGGGGGEIPQKWTETTRLTLKNMHGQQSRECWKAQFSSNPQ